MLYFLITDQILFFLIDYCLVFFNVCYYSLAITIDALPEELWVVGDACVLQLDGKKWTKHIYPNNV